MENAVSMDFSSIFGGAGLLATTKELSKPMSTGVGKLTNVKLDVNEKNGMPNVSFEFTSVVNGRTVRDYLRTSNAKDCYKSVHRLRYLAELAGKRDLIAKIPQQIEIIHSFTSETEGENAGILKSFEESTEDKTLSVMFRSDIKELNEMSQETLDSLGWGGKQLIVKTVNQQAVCEAFVEIGKALIGNAYKLTIETNDRDWATVKKYETVG
jgi:hypothetical protein